MTIAVLRHVSPTMIIATIVIVVAATARLLLRNRQAEADKWIKLVSWATPVVLLVLFFLPTLFLQYRLDEAKVTIRTVISQEQIALSDIAATTVVDYRLAGRTFGTSTFAYHVGQFNVGDLGRLQVYAGSPSGRGVLIETRDGRRLLLSPADPEQFVAALEARQQSPGQ